MVRLFCRNCKFKYTPRTTKAELPSRCGNCGSVGSIQVEPDADQILRES